MRLRARLHCLGFFAALSLAATSCALNPQPEPPAGEETSGTGGSAGSGAGGSPALGANDAGRGSPDPDLTGDAASAPPSDKRPSADDHSNFDNSGQLPPVPGGFENSNDGGSYDRDAGRTDEDPNTPDAGAALSL